MTLDLLSRMAGIICIRALARAAGINDHSLHARIRRGQPELSPSEVKSITMALAEIGLSIVQSGKRRR